jgi:hypothetical protein
MAVASMRQVPWVRRLWLIGLAIGFALAACSDRSSPESLGHTSQALTAAQQRIFGFEAVGPGSSDWTTSSGTLSQSTRHVEGSSSLAIANGGNAEIKSAALSSLGPVADKVTLDLLLPVVQPNPDWMGTLKLVIECPSQQLWYEGLAEYQLLWPSTTMVMAQKICCGSWITIPSRRMRSRIGSGIGPIPTQKATKRSSSIGHRSTWRIRVSTS